MRGRAVWPNPLRAWRGTAQQYLTDFGHQLEDALFQCRHWFPSVRRTSRRVPRPPRAPAPCPVFTVANGGPRAALCASLAILSMFSPPFTGGPCKLRQARLERRQRNVQPSALENAAVKGVRYVRLFADAAGESHFEDVSPALSRIDFSPPTPSMNVSAFAPAKQWAFVEFPEGWSGSWHPGPQRQVFFFLAGAVEVAASDGELRRFTAGAVVLVGRHSGQGSLQPHNRYGRLGHGRPVTRPSRVAPFPDTARFAQPLLVRPRIRAIAADDPRVAGPIRCCGSRSRGTDLSAAGSNRLLS
jgi:hypothetical protein